VSWMRRFCFGGLLLLALANLADADEPHRVLLLHSFGPHFAPWNTISTRFREELRDQSPHPVDLYEASLQGERFGEPLDERPFIDYLRGLFAGRDLPLIVAMGAPAARFMLRNRPQLFPSSPLLIAAADVRTFSDSTLTLNDTAVATTFDQALHIDNILQILPDTKDIVVAIGDSPLERFWTADIQRSFQRFVGRVTFHWFNDLSAEEMVKRVAGLPPRSAIYYATVRVDARGAPQEGDRVLTQFIELGRAPIFSYVDSYFGHGIVGGPLFSTRDIARKAAEVAVRILNGETAGNIKTPPLGLGTPVYDWRELQRWHISESVLPPGSIVQFREPTAWERYWLQIFLVCAALVAQAGLISWLLYEQRRRRLAEVQSRNSMAELTFMNRRAAAGELSASIAHEVNQPLTVIAAKASAALRRLRVETPDLEKVKTSLQDIVAAAHRAADIVTSIRAMFRKDAIERAPIDINGLIQTVLSIVRIDLQKNGVELQLHLDERLPTVHGDNIQLQQVVLNLVMNAIEAIRPATTRVLKITTTLQAGMVHVSIEDTGIGIDPADLGRVFKPLFTTKATGTGMGLAICHSIIESHDGRIWASAGASGGSIFQFELPIGEAR
jgi:signal transduction histidine kinase